LGGLAVEVCCRTTMAAARHQQVLDEMASDPETCPVCGGWYGRKPGTKPFCTASDCPGRFAAQVAAEPKIDSPLLNRRAPSSDKATFADKRRDDLEAAQIKSSPVRRDQGVVNSRREAPSVTPPMRSSELASRGNARASSSAAPSASVSSSVASAVSDEDMLNVGCRECSAGTSHILGGLWLRYFRRMVATFLMVANVITIFLLILLPYLPDPGSQSASEICFDLVSPALRFDRSLVKGGPCFAFQLEFVDPAYAGG